jgi:peptide deformylase
MLVVVVVVVFHLATRLREQAETVVAETAQIRPLQALMEAQTPVEVAVVAGTLVGGLQAAQVGLALFLFVMQIHSMQPHQQQAVLL